MTPPVAGADFLAALVANCFLGMARSVDRRARLERREEHTLPGGFTAGGLAGSLLGSSHGGEEVACGRGDAVLTEWS